MLRCPRCGASASPNKEILEQTTTTSAYSQIRPQRRLKHFSDKVFDGRFVVRNTTE